MWELTSVLMIRKGRGVSGSTDNMAFSAEVYWLLSRQKREFGECNELFCSQGGQANLNVFLSCRRWSPLSREDDLPHLPLLKLLENQSPIPGRKKYLSYSCFNLSACTDWNQIGFQVHLTMLRAIWSCGRGRWRGQGTRQMWWFAGRGLMQI